MEDEPTPASTTRIRLFDGLPSGIRNSMQKDLASRRQLELDAIGGPIMRGGERNAKASSRRLHYGGPDCYDSREG